jgi:hypothetical protein
VVQRKAEDFDEEAVKEYLKVRDKKETEKPTPLPYACPSSQLSTFVPSFPGKVDNVSGGDGGASALSHWPVQIALVPPTAPFLKGAHLLIAADCTPFAYPHFHRDFLQGKVVLVGCPKFDDVKSYVQKFTEIFNTADIKSITLVVMEVPCCQGLPMIVEKGMNIANKDIPLEKVIISARGHILKRENAAA